MANMKCRNCEAPFDEPHTKHCFWEGKVTIERCATDQMVSESIEVEAHQSDRPVELSLGLSDHLHFEDKL